MSAVVRQATDSDALAIRRLVTESLLLAAFDAPSVSAASTNSCVLSWRVIE